MQYAVEAINLTKVTVFVTTRYMDEAEHAHRVSLMLSGRLIACESPEAMKSASVPAPLLEVECEPVVPALDLLPSVEDVFISVLSR